VTVTNEEEEKVTLTCIIKEVRKGILTNLSHSSNSNRIIRNRSGLLFMIIYRSSTECKEWDNVRLKVELDHRASCPYGGQPLQTFKKENWEVRE